MNELSLTNITVIAIAKGRDRHLGREEFYALSSNFALRRNDPVLFFVQCLRDEAHRFAIGAHRKKRLPRSKSLTRSDRGVGGSRKRALLTYFGSAKGVSLAALEDLKKLTGFLLVWLRKFLTTFVM